nr:YehR family protein [Staphylococcus epidermidis]
MEVTYTYKGDEIIKQKSVNTLKYSDFSLNDDTSKKIMKEAIEKESKKCKTLKA